MAETLTSDAATGWRGPTAATGDRIPTRTACTRACGWFGARPIAPLGVPGSWLSHRPDGGLSFSGFWCDAPHVRGSLDRGKAGRAPATSPDELMPDREGPALPGEGGRRSMNAGWYERPADPQERPKTAAAMGGLIHEYSSAAA